MSYEAWRREVALGRMADWDEEKRDYANAPRGRACGECIYRMMHHPPTQPFTECLKCGRGLPWLDAARDPELGYREWDDDGSGDE